MGKCFVFESTYPFESYFQTSCIDCFLKESENSTNQCVFKGIRRRQNTVWPKNAVVKCSFVSLFQPIPKHLLSFPDKACPDFFFRFMSVCMLWFYKFSLPFLWFQQTYSFLKCFDELIKLRSESWWRLKDFTLQIPHEYFIIDSCLMILSRKMYYKTLDFQFELKLVFW